jgi:hypothetical protein
MSARLIRRDRGSSDAWHVLTQQTGGGGEGGGGAQIRGTSEQLSGQEFSKRMMREAVLTGG